MAIDIIENNDIQIFEKDKCHCNRQTENDKRDKIELAEIIKYLSMGEGWSSQKV